MGPLDRTVRVLDLSERSPAAAIAGLVLADLGAEVIRVEPVGGDPLRALPGSRVWLRGQASVTVGPEQIRDGSWEALRASADVILDTLQPWTQKPSGLLEGFDSTRQIRAVLTAYPRTPDELAGTGAAAAYPVCGELIEAQYGLQHFQDGVREAPIFLGWPLAINGAAWLLEIGILGALFERLRTGHGLTVTTSLLDGIAILSNARWVGGAKVGVPLYSGTRITTRHSNVRMVVSLFQCADGNWIQVHTGPRGAFDRLMKVLGRDDLVVENTSVHALGTPLDPAVAQDLWRYLDRTFRSRAAEDWCTTLAEVDVCCMPALKAGEVLWLKQMEDNGLVEITPDGSRQLGRLAKFARTPMAVGQAVPRPGEHNPILLQANGNSKMRLVEKGNPGVHVNGSKVAAATVGPLEGLLALDFGAYMAGPFANRMFADLGARVIKVEEFNGDPMRGPQLIIFLGVQRGKESIAVDLKSAEGRRLVHDLVRRADIVHHNMRAGAMERLGMGWEALSVINPRLIYCHSSGYGNAGPWSHLPTFEPLHSALTGMLSRTGGEGNPPEHYATHMDYGCGLTSTAMVLAALCERERSGRGQYLEVPQTGAGLVAMADVHGRHGQQSETFPLDHEQRGHAPTNALYRTSDGWIVVACYSEREWQGVRRALGIGAAEWPTYQAARAERLDRSATARLVEALLSRLTTASAERCLRAEDVPCAVPAPLEAAAAVAEPMLQARGLIVREQHAQAGEVLEVGHTIRFSGANRLNLRPAPVVGEHSVAILRELGRSDEEIRSLGEQKVVNRGPLAGAASATVTARG